MGYIRVPIETNPTTLAQETYDFIIANAPGWTPADGNLEVWIIKAMAAKAAESRTLASDVPDDIYINLGSSLMGIPPLAAVSATADSTWTLIDTLGHTIPDGTFVGIRNANGDLVTFATVGDVIVSPGFSVTSAGEVLLRAADTGTDANGLSGTPELIDVIDWVQSIALVGSTGGGVDDETLDDYLVRLTRKLQGLSTVPILPQDFANAAKDADPGVFRSVAIDLYNPLHNLLTLDEASAETGATGYANLANSVVSSTSAQAADGTKSVALTSIAGGDMNAILVREVPVTPNQRMTAIANVRAAVSARTVKIGIRWIDASHATIGSIVYGATGTDSTANYATQVTVTAVAPINAAFMKIVLFVTGTGGASEVHYFDKMGIRHGTTTDWVAGGTNETNNIKTVTEAAVDTAGAPVSGGIKTNIQNYITAHREANWINHVMDPNYTNIDVDATVVVSAGYDPTSTYAEVVAAIENYLDPSVWGRDPGLTGSDAISSWTESTILYYNELITLVSNVAGVDRVVDLTCNIHGGTPARVNVTLQQPASLTTAGTVTAHA